MEAYSRGRWRSGAHSARPESSDYKFIEWYREHPVEDDLKLLKWNDEIWAGKGFVPWYPFEHPQLGPVELGGWDSLYTWSNPPHALLENEIERFPKWLVWHLLISPKLELLEASATALGGDAWRVRLVVHNTGWLPSYVTKRALNNKLTRGVICEIELPAALAWRRGGARGSGAARRACLQARRAKRLGRLERGYQRGSSESGVGRACPEGLCRDTDCAARARGHCPREGQPLRRIAAPLSVTACLMAVKCRTFWSVCITSLSSIVCELPFEADHDWFRLELRDVPGSERRCGCPRVCRRESRYPQWDT